ncbi:MAG: hypothetical protein HGA37_11190 [Lentimicrobium sp.]|nr:hypothetical protein [Lentimicrobium sp.]
MKTLNEAQQLIFDAETTGLEYAGYSLSSAFIESLGFRFLRYHKLANLKGDDAELEVYEDLKGRKIVKLCVTQYTHSEGDLLHQSCYVPAELIPILDVEYKKQKF